MRLQKLAYFLRFFFLLLYIKVCENTKNKKEKKSEEIKTKFWLLISWKWLRQFSSNLVRGVAYLAGTSAVKLVSVG